MKNTGMKNLRHDQTSVKKLQPESTGAKTELSKLLPFAILYFTDCGFFPVYLPTLKLLGIEIAFFILFFFLFMPLLDFNLHLRSCRCNCSKSNRSSIFDGEKDKEVACSELLFRCPIYEHLLIHTGISLDTV